MQQQQEDINVLTIFVSTDDRVLQIDYVPAAFDPKPLVSVFLY